MKVKIGNKIYDPNDEPILLILSDTDKENIANMAEEAHYYCVYPDTLDAEYIKKWAEIEVDFVSTEIS